MFTHNFTILPQSHYSAWHNSLYLLYDYEMLVGWLVLLRIYVALAVFQQYSDLEAGDNQFSEIQVARRGIEPRTSCSASQELKHSATAAPEMLVPMHKKYEYIHEHLIFSNFIFYVCTGYDHFAQNIIRFRSIAYFSLFLHRI